MFTIEKREVVELLEGIINANGFEVANLMFGGLPGINTMLSDYVSFTYKEKSEFKVQDKKVQKIIHHISIEVSTCRMAVESSQQLRKAADQMIRAAALVDEINTKAIAYVEQF